MNATWRIVIQGLIALSLASITIADVDRPAKNHVARTSLYTSILAQFENCTYDSTAEFSDIRCQPVTAGLSSVTHHTSGQQNSLTSHGITGKPSSQIRKYVDALHKCQTTHVHQNVIHIRQANVRLDGDVAKHKHQSRHMKPMDIALIHFESLRRQSIKSAVTPIGEFTLTAYSLGRASTGKVPGMPGYGITFSGTKAKVMRTVAVDPRIIPIGTPIFIEGIGWRLAEDTGGAVKGRHIDVLLNSHEEAIRFGVRRHIRVYLERSYAESVMSRLSKE